ncbi:MAG: hypothetical protein BAJALOKI1v1_110014 [Promethearchaeota archaeon]|nr:MAG: hypothetical protein BAJALOKI1v1_110014 [Candidatus Lokiarchaeota archaeon]
MSDHYPNNHNHNYTVQICHFCQRRQEIAYYCENCGTSCCSNCLLDEKIDNLVCQDCNSKNIHDTGNKKVCKECDSENVLKTSQTIKGCPRCHSNRIVNIFEKKETLEQKFLELIKNTRLLLEPFRNLINELHLTKDKIKKARDPPIQCYHFPKMESELVSIFKLLDYIEDTLLERINIYFHHLALNRNYFFDIYSQPNSNVRIIEGILDNLRESYSSIESFIEAKIEKIEVDIKALSKNLEFINKITMLFEEYKRFINLADDEKPIYAIDAKISNSHNSNGILQREKGVLFITNYDLSFIHEFGVIKKKQNLIFKAPVEDIIRIKEIGKLFKKLYIEFAYGNYELTLPSNAISRVIEYILLARNFDETSIYDHKSWEKLNTINCDLSDLKNFIEEGITSFFSLRCNMNNEKHRGFIHEHSRDHSYCGQSPNHDYRRPSSTRPSLQSSPDRSDEFYFKSYAQSNGTNRNRNIDQDESNFYRQKDRNDYQHQSENLYSAPLRSQNTYPMPSPYEYEDHFPDRFNPQRFKTHDTGRSYQNKDRSPINKEQKSILMKKLERAQKEYGNGQPFLNQVNKVANDFINQGSFHRPSPSRINNGELDVDMNMKFQDYNRNHLSDFFNTDTNTSTQERTTPKNRAKPTYSPPSEEDEEEFENLKAERYCILETIKTLEKKFDEGRLTRNDFMKSHMSLKKDLFRVNSKIKNIRLKQESRWDFNRNY